MFKKKATQIVSETSIKKNLESFLIGKQQE